MRLPRISHKRTFATIALLTALFWVAGCGYLSYQRNLLERLQLAGQLHAQQVAWQAVTTAHRVAMQAYFDSSIMRPEVLHILQSGLSPDHTQQDRARVLLFRTLSPTYELLRQRDVRQLHFHTPDNHSFLRFHSPHNSGDSLVSSRPSVVTVNRTLKPIFGFETGRVVIGFRNVLPIVWNGKHLGSVELSQPFEAVRRGLHDLDPAKEYLLVLKASVLLPKLFDEHKKLYAPSLFSQDWLVEDPKRELPDSTAPLSPETKELYKQLKESKDFMTALASGTHAAVAIRNGERVSQVCLIPLHDTDGVLSAIMLAFIKSPELEKLYDSHRTNLLIFTALVSVGGGSIYLFLASTKRSREQEQQLALISSNIADGVYVMDKEGRITFTNQRTSELLGFSAAEFKGQIAHDLFHRHNGHEHTPLHTCPIYQVMQTRGRYEGEEQFACRDGKLLTVQVSSQPMLKSDRVVGSVTVFRDVSEHKLMEEQLRLLSITDPLTGVYNRRFLRETVCKELYRAERHGEPFSLVMLDLDHFKSINDRYGHDAGDQVLRHLVELIKGRIRASDCLARWGGEEFMLLPHATLSSATALAQKLLDDLCSSQVQGVGSVTASCGVTAYRQGDTVELLVQRADTLLYAAKQAGRCCVRSDDV